MADFKLIVKRVIEKSDVILEVLDARFIEETRNRKIEQQLKKKILIQVINKCDYVEKSYLDEIKKTLINSVFVSAKKHLGMTILKKKIKALANIKGIRKPVVGVLGYPNVGKSSIINALKGKGSAKTSPEAGFTKAEQYLRVDQDFMMIDTPGIIQKEEDDLVLVGAENPDSIKDPDLALIKLMQTHPGLIEKRYNIKIKEDKEQSIEEIAIILNLKKKGNIPDIERTARKILKDWIDGKIKI